jgi:hypothetical protein
MSSTYIHTGGRYSPLGEWGYFLICIPVCMLRGEMSPTYIVAVDIRPWESVVFSSIYSCLYAKG